MHKEKTYMLVNMGCVNTSSFQLLQKCTRLFFELFATSADWSPFSKHCIFIIEFDFTLLVMLSTSFLWKNDNLKAQFF
jgi:hypothetical protein